jgi:hypothetical protein
VPGVAAGPSGLILVDVDSHGSPPPPNLATGLLPGINLVTEPIPRDTWADLVRFRDGRNSLALLARLRGGTRPWPTGPEHQPVTAATPSGGVHLWYRAPAPHLRQALSDPHGRYGLAWQVDLKAAGPTASLPAPPPLQAPTGSAAATPPNSAGCPPGSPKRSSASPSQHHARPPPLCRCRRPAAGPARPHTWPPSSPVAPLSSPR